MKIGEEISTKREENATKRPEKVEQQQCGWQQVWLLHTSSRQMGLEETNIATTGVMY